MNNVKLGLHDFKCFKDATFEFRNLTIFTGANASGKSSVIQALMFLKQIAQYAYVNKNTIPMSIPESGLTFGHVGDVLHYTNGETIDAFSLEFNGQKVIIREDDLDSESAKFEIPAKGLFIEQVLFERMSFLSAERIGPREESIRKASTKGDFDCGLDGRYTASIIDLNFMASADADRSIETEDKKNKFSVLLDAWVDYIFPGISVRSINLSEKKCKMVMRSRVSGNAEVSAPNIGFGITYVLPILVEALLIPKGGWLVVENPEVHLHAKAQSNLGYFLGVIAASGVRIVLETHSEHIVDGVRRAMVCRECLKPEDVAIYFLEPQKGNTTDINVTKIEMDEDGNLSDSPIDFFDQVRQDMMEIISTVRSRKA